MKFKILKLKFISAALFLFSFSARTFARGQADFPPNYYDIIAVLLVAIVVLAFLGLIYFEEKGKTVKQKSPLFAKIRQMLTRSTPVEEEESILLDHDYDGIKELDNRIPPWYNYLFYVTILFGIYYLLNYHVFHTGKLMYEEYDEEMKMAQIKKTELMNSGTLVNENTVTLLTSPADLSVGEKIFKSNCVACHISDGGGLVGPNLTDKYWLHGGGIKNIFKTIKYGVPAKGMISWQTQLNPKQIQEVASYVWSLQGTKPANPKAPQGTIWEEPGK